MVGVGWVSISRGPIQVQEERGAVVVALPEGKGGKGGGAGEIG